MARQKKQPEVEQEQGAPEWMVTFSDCMTLLLTFFVLLLSFSSFDDENEANYKKMSDSFAEQFSFDTEKTIEKEAVFDIPEIKKSQQQRKGSEKPTLDERRKDNLKKETDPEDFRNQKIFLVSSEEIFWGKGTLISLSGQRLLADMADYLQQMQNRVVITECDQKGIDETDKLGLQRAWAIVNYLATKQGLDREMFSISASSTVSKGNLPPEAARAERMLEIILLERGVYN